MKRLYSAEDLEQAVVKWGFLPFFKCGIVGFSVEELSAPELWFEEGIDGPWEWKGPVIRNWNCTYGKIYNRKAGFVSLEWLPDLVNYRRATYHANKMLLNSDEEDCEQIIYDTVVKYESLLSKEIKSLCGFHKPKQRQQHPFEKLLKQKAKRPKGESFDTAITRLQMATLLVTADFEYLCDKHGHPYGWGVARYTTPEALFGKECLTSCGKRTPEESKVRILAHLSNLFPHATETQLLKIIE